MRGGECMAEMTEGKGSRRKEGNIFPLLEDGNKIYEQLERL